MLDQFWSFWNFLLTVRNADGIGFGIYFNHKWAQACWPKDWEEICNLSDITFLELFPIAAALFIWRSELKNKKILFHVDNQAVVTIINIQKNHPSLLLMQIKILVPFRPICGRYKCGNGQPDKIIYVYKFLENV